MIVIKTTTPKKRLIWPGALCAACLSGCLFFLSGCRVFVHFPDVLGLTASDGIFTDHVEVKWPVSSDAEGYVLYRKPLASNDNVVRLAMWDTAVVVALRNTSSKDQHGEPVSDVFITFDDNTVIPGMAYDYFVQVCSVARCNISRDEHGHAGTLPTPRNEFISPEWVGYP